MRDHDDSGSRMGRNALWAMAPGALYLLLAPRMLLSSEAAAVGPCANATAVAALAAAEEPGERLVVSGTVFAPDGATPAGGVFLYVYNTDATGRYNSERGQPPRLRGWIKTGPDGRYEYRTIRPVSYPGSRIPAHVHTQLWGGGFPPQEGPELLFEGDPFPTAADKSRSEALGRFAFIRPARRDGRDVWRVEHDLKLNTAGGSLSGILHGVEPCRVRPTG